jgi:hypothetical protein
MTLSMTCEQFEAILPDLLDDDTAAAAMTQAVRGHLAACTGCAALHADLERIRDTAAALPALRPGRDLWNGIASRIETPIVPLVDGVAVRSPRRQLSWRAAGIAAVLLVAVNAGITYQLLRRGVALAPDDGGSGATSVASTLMPAPAAMRTTVEPEPILIPAPSRLEPRRPSGPTFVLATNGAEGPENPQQQPTRRREAAKLVYDREINRLRAIVDSGRSKLDPATAAILDRNLRIIDTAIEQCNEALTRDSASSFLLASLNNAYQTKVKLLRIAAAAASRE